MAERRDRRAPHGRWLYAAGAALAMAIVGSSFAVLDTLRAYPQAGGQAARYAVGAALLFALAGRRLPRPTARQAVRLALLAASGLAAFNLLVLAAETSMDPGSVGVIVAAVPVLLALAGPLQDGRRPERRVVGAAVVVAVGAAAVQGLGGEMTAAGLAAALGALACEAAFSLLAAPLLAPLGPVAVSAWATVLAVPMLLAAGLAIDGPSGFLRAPTADEALGLGVARRRRDRDRLRALVLGRARPRRRAHRAAHGRAAGQRARGRRAARDGRAHRGPARRRAARRRRDRRRTLGQRTWPEAS